MDIIVSRHTEVHLARSIISLYINPSGHLSGEGFPPGSWLPPSNQAIAHGEGIKYKNGKKGEGGARSRGEQGGGEYLPPIPGTGPASCELPTPSEADTGAGLSGDLREAWEPHPEGTCLPSWDRKEGPPGRCPLSPVH